VQRLQRTGKVTGVTASAAPQKSNIAHFSLGVQGGFGPLASGIFEGLGPGAPSKITCIKPLSYPQFCPFSRNLPLSSRLAPFPCNARPFRPLQSVTASRFAPVTALVTARHWALTLVLSRAVFFNERCTCTAAGGRLRFWLRLASGRWCSSAWRCQCGWSLHPRSRCRWSIACVGLVHCGHNHCCH
jgi:hypothetical protein